MTRQNGRARAVPPVKSGIRSLNGQLVQNLVLQSLPSREWKVISAKIEFVKIPTRFLFSQMAEPIANGYFINIGVASILNVMPNGKSVEVGLTGNEGFVGLPLLVGFATSPTRAIAQIAGSAWRLNAKQLPGVLRACPELSKYLHRYAQQFALQTTQVAACNRLHRVDQRLARWLLMSQDRVDSSSFLLTQEFLSHMLGTRRASVTVAARVLHKVGLITYRRGRVTVETRAGLERAACPCYGLLTRQLKRWDSDLRQINMPALRTRPRAKKSASHGPST
jgi:CRP-like cAMP-binding protein